MVQMELLKPKLKFLKNLEGRYVAKPQPLTICSKGTEIGGWVLLPKDYDPEKRYPAVFDIHGGPKTVYGPVFYHEMQLWANMGYFVFFCNPRGSDSRGNKFADIRGRFGKEDYDDLMVFTDEVLKQYPRPAAFEAVLKRPFAGHFGCWKCLG